MPDIGTCASCKAQIMWVRHHQTGNVMPLDREPVKDGNIVILDGKGVVLSGDLFDEMVDQSMPRYVSHFATCTAAAKHRKRKEKK